MIWTALILGFVGSLHCVGMCSPLALTVTTKALTNRLLYNTGRIFTYAAMGAGVASVGWALPMSQYQDLLSLILGMLLIIIGLTNISHLKIPVAFNPLLKLNIILKKSFAKYLINKSVSKVFLLGILNGFLPCGLTFLALTYCVILPTPGEGFVFMLLFGAGTLPALLASTGAFDWAAQRFSFNQQRITVSLFVISGALLIARLFIVHIPHTTSVADSMIDIVICTKK